MEIGAVKQAFNEELIRLKKNLTQAKIQIIHKLTRKAKAISEKKRPKNLEEKFKRKAQSAVDEVLIIKKIKVKDLAYFILTHKKELKDFLNKPQADEHKACARLLMHKVLQGKYNFIRTKFANMPVRELMMSREERRKIKKELNTKEKKNKTKSKANAKDEDQQDSNVGNSDNEFQNDKDLAVSDDCSDADSKSSFDEDEVTKEDKTNEDQLEENNLSKRKQKNLEVDKNSLSDKSAKEMPSTKAKNEMPNKKKVAVIKNKNLKEKLVNRNFKKEATEPALEENKIVDPFFITSSGENYLSVAEPRAPDEVKEIHKHGNRKLRRAKMFGRALKSKPKNFVDNAGGFGKADIKKFNGSVENKDFKDKRKTIDISEHKEKPVVKLHPSWEAKKKQSSILPFEGKKIIFNED